MYCVYMFIITIFMYVSVQATSLASIERALNGFKSLGGGFTQISPSGERLEGRFSLSKPGLLRLDYDAPSHQQIFTHKGTLYFYDRKTKDVSETPLESSMAQFLLAEHLRFDERVFVETFEEDEQIIRLTLRKPRNHDLGSLTLIFDRASLNLIQWIIVDAQGQRTVVNLTIRHKGKGPMSIETDPAKLLMTRVTKK